MAIHLAKKVPAKKPAVSVVVAPEGYDNFDEALKDFIITVDKDMIITSDDNTVQYRDSSAKWAINDDNRIVITVRSFHHIKDVTEALAWSFHNDVHDSLATELKFPCVVLGCIRNGKTTKFITANTFNAAIGIVHEIFDEK